MLQPEYFKCLQFQRIELPATTLHATQIRDGILKYRKRVYSLMDVLGNTPRTLKRGHTIIKAKITKQFFKNKYITFSFLNT